MKIEDQLALEAKERPAFEEWAKQNAFSLRLPGRVEGYPALTKVAWKAWLGRAAHGVQNTDGAQHD